MYIGGTFGEWNHIYFVFPEFPAQTMLDQWCPLQKNTIYHTTDRTPYKIASSY